MSMFSQPKLFPLALLALAFGLAGCSDVKFEFDYFPEVSLKGNTSISSGGDVVFTAKASDDKGISKVEFFEGTTKLAEATNAPYAFTRTFALVDNGQKTFTAKATDSIGQVSESNDLKVVVNIADTIAPSLNLVANQNPFNQVGTLQLNANATDNVGVSHVEFYENNTKVLDDTSAPFEYSRNFAIQNNGAFVYKAIAFDAAGNQTTSALLNIDVNVLDTTAPTVALSASNTNVLLPGSTVLTATASDDVGVSHVEFYENNIKVLDDTSAPFEYSRNFVIQNNGAFVYKAIAYDVANNQQTSNVLNLNVNIPDTTAPTVALAATNTNIVLPGSTVLTATTTDNIGVTKVEFYEGTNMLAAVTTAPYTFTKTFNILENGTHNYTAKSYDAAGNVGTSALQAVLVNIPDTQAPTNPAVALSNATAFDSVDATLTATAQDNVGITKVEFYEGVTLQTTLTSAPYVWTAHYERPDNGNKNYAVKFYDAAGNVSNATANNNINVASGTLLYGSALEDRVWSTAFDAAGNMFVGGCFGGGVVDLGYVAVSNIQIPFVAKFKPDGKFAWAKAINTNAVFNSCTGAVAVTPDGGVVAVGYTYTSGGIGDSDYFIKKFDTNGVDGFFVAQIGSTNGEDELWDVAVDSTGNIYATGHSASPASIFSGQPDAGYDDAILVKYSPLGALQWARGLGSTGYDYGDQLAIAPNGEIQVFGHTDGKLGVAVRGGFDNFVARYNATGTKLGVEQFGSLANEGLITEALVDASNNSYFSTVTVGGYEGKVLVGNQDGVLVKRNSTGGLAWVRQFGQAGATTWFNGLALDASNNVFVAGTTDVKLTGQNSYGSNDVFLAKVVGATGALTVLNQFGGTGDDQARDLKWKGSKLVLTGVTNAALDGKAPVGDFDIFHLTFDTLGKLH